MKAILLPCRVNKAPKAFGSFTGRTLLKRSLTSVSSLPVLFLALHKRKIISPKKVSGCFVSNAYSVFSNVPNID